MGERTKITVQFGNVSYGKDTASIGCKAERWQFENELEGADEMLNRTRLEATLKANPEGTDNDQKQIEGTYPSVTDIFESKRFGVKGDEISFRLVMTLGNMDDEKQKDFTDLRNRNGVIEISQVDELVEESE